MGYLKNFHYEVLGADHLPKLVFLHGLMGSGKNWARIAKVFNEQFQVLLFDQRGHGRSFKPEQGYAPEDYSEDLLKILQELNWSQICLVGHSLGGRNAIYFAAAHPNRVEKLVIEDIGLTVQQRHKGNIKRLLSLVPTPFASKEEARFFFQTEFIEKIKDNPKAKVLSSYFYANIEKKPSGLADWRFSKAGILESVEQGRQSDQWPLWQSLQMPTLLIRGEHSEDLTEPDFTKMQATHPNVKGVEIGDSGHWVHYDQPGEFIMTLKNFLIPV